MAAGFPLVAEGQVGAYYPPHIFFYSLFPFPVAYTLLILIHVLIGGMGFYRYAEKIGLSKEAASVCAVLFSFSSVYGGCFSNTATLKVLAWLPWAMLLPERLIAAKGKDRVLWTSLLGVLFALMWTAGAMQVALYAVGYLFFYWILRFKPREWLFFIAANVLGVLLSLPQWTATLELIPCSVRQGESAAFALSGSLYPPFVASFLYPYWGLFLGSSLYLGTAGILLVLVYLMFKQEKTAKTHLFLAAIFFLLAFGRYNPVYKFLIDTFSLTILRFPHKFAFFGMVSLCVLAGYGFDRLGQTTKTGVSNAKKGVFLVILGLCLTGPFLAQWVSHRFEDRINETGKRISLETFEGKKDPKKSAEGYQKSFTEYFESMRQERFSYSNQYNVLSIVFILISGIFIFACFLRGAPSYWRDIFLPLLLAANLLIFGYPWGSEGLHGSGFIGNVRGISEPPSVISQLIERRQTADGSAMIEWAKDANEVFSPNSNLLYGIRHAGGYSPLLLNRYYELSKDLGIADSSLGRKPYDLGVWNREIGVISAFGVSQVLSSEKIDLPGAALRNMMKETSFENGKRIESRQYLYEFADTLPLVYAVYRWKEITSAEERLAYLKGPEFKPFEEAVVEYSAELLKPSDDYTYSPAEIVSLSPKSIEAHVDLVSDGVIVFRSAFYPRWKAELDGRKAELLPVNHAFSGIYAAKGSHEVKFYYDESGHRAAEGVAAGALILLVFANRFVRRGRR